MVLQLASAKKLKKNARCMIRKSDLVYLISKNNKVVYLFIKKGAWYVCFDKGLRPNTNKCNVLSFGIRDDPSFDQAMNGAHGCRVHSFDPYFEDLIFTKIRHTDSSVQTAHSPTLAVNEKWTFHRIGIAGVASSARSVVTGLKMKDLITFEQVLDLTALRGQMIDVLKIDIEGAEQNVLERIDTEYLCGHVKQFLLETHASLRKVAVRLLMKLEKCFYLFQRNTRFFFHTLRRKDGAAITEFESPDGYLLQLSHFKDEIELAWYMLTMGELYFVNLNFL
jgi:hypothetical protein